MDIVIGFGLGGLSFEIFENIIYTAKSGPLLGIIRGLTPGHLCVGVIMGFYLGKYYYNMQKINRILMITIPVLVHTIFDTALNWMTDDIPVALQMCGPLAVVLMLVLAIHSATLSGAKEGLTFYLIPDFSKINFSVVVGAMNQAFFTLSIGIGSMAIFGSYIGKERSLLGESVNVILLDTFVAIMAGFIMFPACFTYGIEVSAGPSLLFDTMATVFNNMAGGRIWGSLFFLFMVFAAFSTELAVFENILACVRELTGWSRPKGCLVCGVGIFLVSLTTALGYSVLGGFHPFAEDSAWLDLWDFIVSKNLLPIGALVFSLFCCYKFGWGWDKFVEEANAGQGLKVQNWMKPIFRYVVPVCVAGLYIYGLLTFKWK